MRLALVVLLLGLGLSEEEECLGCRCQEETLTCCHLELVSSGWQPVAPCPSSTSITSITIQDSILGPEELSPNWLEAQGITPSAVRRLNVNNSSLEGLRLQGLSMLSHLQVEGTTGGGWLEEPPHSVIKLHLGGATWPCMAPEDPSQKNTTVWDLDSSKISLASSEASLTFGLRMSWLLEEHWAGAWQDVNKTLCVVHESEEAKEAWYGKVQEGEGARHKEGQPRTVFSFLKFTQKTIDLCPPSCTCMIAKGRVKFAGTRSLEVAVACSDHSLSEMPPALPPNTISLDLAHNQISSLEALGEQSPTYENLTRLDLSNNLLKSLEGLETSWFMNRGARLLDLRGNKLTELDLQTLEPIMDRSHEFPEFFLSGNPWSCNCHNIKTFQDFISKYNKLIKDVEKMQCQEYPDQALEKLDYKKICSSTAYGLLVFCSLELLLLVAVVVKLTCDCVEYKRTGNLPWCARKLCWSVPGIPRPHWRSRPQLPSSFCSSHNTDSRGSVGQGSSGYLTSSSGGSQGGRPGGRETAVVRFLPQQQ